MGAATHGDLRLLPGGDGRRAPTRRITGWLPLLLLALAIAVAALVSSRSPRRKAIRALPEAERRELLSRTVDDMRRLCGDRRAPGLEDHCRELASFAARFDECRGECEALVRRELAPVPTR